MQEREAKNKDEMMSNEYNRKIEEDDEIEDTMTPEDDGYLDDD